jgi:sialate O-acetylesterase
MLVLLLLAAPAGMADVTLPRLIGDGVVLQRDVEASLWGWADDGEQIDVLLDGEPVAQVAASDGNWRVALPARPAGGPHTLEFVGNNRVTVQDVLFGDVWIASGQSNMQLPMERVREKYEQDIAAADLPLMRHFTVPREFDFDAPRRDLDGGEWQAATPESILELSAAAFFFARDLTARHGVPVGIVSSNYGGSAAESWMSEAALQAYPHYLDVARHWRSNGHLQNAIATDQADNDRWYSTLDASDTGLTGATPWSAADFDDSGWATMTVPGFWADTDVGDVNGSVWFRREFTLRDEQAGLPAKLMLGRIVDADLTYVNGQLVGNVTYQYPPRRYNVDVGVLRPGRNSIAVRVINTSGRGGFIEDKPYWIRVGEETIDLRGEWRFRVGARMLPLAAPRFVRHRQPLGFYNAMLAPLLPMSIKGVIWYQGETNADRPDEYRNLFRAMIRNWRQDFGQGDFPFVFVQLANFMATHDQPTESEWAETRDAQTGALAEPNTAMAVIIDVGEWNDIHPLDKKTVGERLALAARAVAYGEGGLTWSGPMWQSVTRDDESLVVQFESVAEGLVARDGEPAGFAIAGADRKFRWASVRIDGDRAVLSHDDIVQPEYVRYAWADNPDTANLYNSAGLPAVPFEARAGEVNPLAD